MTDEELDVTFKVLAGAVVDDSGEPNTASNTLHVSVNRTVSVGDASATEGTGGTADFEVTLGSRNDCETVTVDWATADGTATAGEDYTADSGKLTFGPGETTKTVSIEVLDDTASEGEESFKLKLSNASRATIADAEATGTISDDAADSNTAPTGLPEISGTAKVGETLTASRTGIADADGLTDATFAWQWIANDGTNDTDIADATSETYTLTSAEQGKTIKVRITFTDDGGTEETLVSAATEAVAAVASRQQVASDTEAPTVTVTSDATGPVTGEFDVTVTFSEPVTGFAMSELEITNGSAVRMLSSPDRTTYTVTIAPAAGVTGTLTVQVPADAAIDAAKNGNTVSGLFGIGVVAALTASFSETPASHDGRSRFELRLSLTSALAPGGASIAVGEALSATGGRVSRVRRVDGRRDLFKMRVRPTGNGTVTVTLDPPTDDCAETGALCTPDGQALSETVSTTIPGPASLPLVSISAGISPVTEGTAASFTLSRTGDATAALTVDVSVSEDGSMVDGTPASTVMFAANSATATLTVATADDEVDESASVVTATVAAGNGYTVDSSANGASVTVDDDDTAPVMTTASPVLVAENKAAIATLSATDEDTAESDLAWSLIGGADKDEVSLSAAGVLAFKTAKDFEVPDDADSDGDYEITVRVTDGANPVDASLTVRLTDVDEVAPEILSASVDGATLTLNFDEALNASASPASSAFSVAVAGTTRGVSQVSVSGSSVALILASAVVAGETVTVRYAVPTGASANPLEDAAGNPVAAFRDRAVTNDTEAAWNPTIDLRIWTVYPDQRNRSQFRAKSDGEKLEYVQTEPLGEWPLANAGITAGEKVNLYARTYSNAGIGSVRLELTGPQTVSRTDNTAPYSLFEDFVGTALSAGTYQLSVTAYPEADLGGTPGTTHTTSFTLETDSTPPSVLVYCGTNSSVSGDEVSVGVRIDEPVLGYSYSDIEFTNVREELFSVRTKPLTADGVSNWEFTVEPDVAGTETTIMVPAGAFRDEAGNQNTASGILHIARDRTVSVADASAVEGTDATIDFEVTLDARNDCETVTVDWATADGTATAGEDYTADSETLTFGPGETSKTVSIAVLDDAVTEDEESFELRLSNASGATLAGETTIGTINDTAADGNAAPTGLPAISGTAKVGETLTASSTGIADADGLTDATFAWQWIANDGTDDTDIADATDATYTLTAAEQGKTIKVRVTFTDDRGTEETLVSAATEAVAATIPQVSIAANSSPVTEGTAAAFTLSRTGSTAAALTVSVSVSEAGKVLSGTPTSSVTFAAGSAQATLSVTTENDAVDEADATITASVGAGSDYTLDPGAATARVDVYDNDETDSSGATVETLWSSTLEWADMNGEWLIANAEDFASAGWSEDGSNFKVWYFAYDPWGGELWLRMNSSQTGGDIPRAGELTLHIGDETVEAGDALSAFASGKVGIAYDIDPGWDVGDRVGVRLTRTVVSEEATASLPGLSVADTQVREAEGAALSFVVTLGEVQTGPVSVRYATSDGTATAGLDYEAVSGMLRFEAGQTSKTVSVPVINDNHDDDGETVTMTLSQPFGAEISDGTATGTIQNTDPMPQAWIARFGRTVAEQVLEAVENRMRAPRTAGVEVNLGGRQVGGSFAPDGGAAAEDGAVADGGPALAGGAEAEAGRNLADWFGQATDPERRLGLESQTMAQREFVLGSSFSFTGGTEREGTYALWGRGAATRFDGRDGDLSLNGEVTSGMLGADWSRDALMAGLVVSHSLGEGSYGGEGGSGAVSSSLTGLYPWGRYALSDRLSVWGVAGYGEGTLTLTPEGEGSIRTDLDLLMAAAGLRGVLVQAPETGGFELAVKTDALGVQTSTAKAQGLEAAEAEVTRLRLGLEGSRPLRFEGGASLTPSVEIGLRHDGGDAETGFGVDIGTGIAWSDPQRGLSMELRGRGLLSHDADGFRERGLSGSLSWDPTPETARGLKLTMSQTLGGQASGGMDALLERGTLAGLAANDTGDSGFARGRFETKLGYGMPAFGDGFTSTPEIGFGFSGERRDYSLGWRLTREGRFGGSFDLSIEAQRQEAVNDNAATVHEIGFKLTARF